MFTRENRRRYTLERAFQSLEVNQVIQLFFHSPPQRHQDRGVHVAVHAVLRLVALPEAEDELRGAVGPRLARGDGSVDVLGECATSAQCLLVKSTQGPGVNKTPSNRGFGKPVLGCIKADVRKKISN